MVSGKLLMRREEDKVIGELGSCHTEGSEESILD